MKNELASGIGTASSFNWRSAIGRGLGLSGISGSSSSSSPSQKKEVTISWSLSCVWNVWLTIHYRGTVFTRKVCWRERVFDLIHIRFKLINFELQIRKCCWMEKKHKYGSIYTVNECCLTLAVVGMPSTPLALCSANFLARLAFSSDVLLGMLAL